MWTAVALVAADSLTRPSAATLAACVASPLLLTLLLTQVSGIPLLEEHAEKKWGADPDYQAYKQRTGVLLPQPLDRAVRFVWHGIWAGVALLVAYLTTCIKPTDPNATPEAIPHE